MRTLLEELGPAVRSAYGEALAQDNYPPSPCSVRTLALKHSADPWALLVLTRGELPELDPTNRLTGWLAPCDGQMRLLYTRPSVLAPSPAALLALQLRAVDLYCHVLDPWRRVVKPRDLNVYADQWLRPARLGELAPRRLPTPDTRLLEARP